MSEPAPITVRRRQGRALFVVAEVLLLLAVPLLSVVGFRAVLDTTGGQVVDPELDLTEPGYEAVLARRFGVTGSRVLWIDEPAERPPAAWARRSA